MDKPPVISLYGFVTLKVTLIFTVRYTSIPTRATLGLFKFHVITERGWGGGVTPLNHYLVYIQNTLT